ncbi:alpha/beta-hydrolase [Aureobasidium pullulans]|nr:alpha/beta-hydrolase [Aureobasidium pullulans]
MEANGSKTMRFTTSNLAILGGAFSYATLAAAQNLSYGADNFYRSDNVTLWPVTFQTQYRTEVTANLFLPDFLDYNSTHPAIVVGHPMGAIKEQGGNLYAQKLAEQGFVTVAIDLPFWGGSEGEPRQLVAPDAYAEGFSAAVDFLGLRSYINRRQIGAIGICGSGGFVISAAKIDPRISAIATSTMYNMGNLNRNGLQHSVSVEQRKQVIANAAAQRWVEAEGGDYIYSEGAPFEINEDSDAVSLEFYDYYRTSRGLFTPASSFPNQTSDRIFSSNTRFINFYPFNDIETISPRPILFVTGDQAHSKEFSVDAYARAMEPKELYWVPGAGHVDLYDRVDLIPFAKITDFFRTSLVGNSSVPTGNETVARRF